VSRLLFVTGTAATVRAGSGTFIGISVLRQALLALGHRVDLVTSAAASPGTLSRLLFNLRRRRVALHEHYDAVVGFDLDGVFVSTPGIRRVASIKGVIAEELQFERGATRLSMRLAAYFEGRNVRRADRVLATSLYAADRIVERYRVARERVHVVPEPIDLARWKAALAAARRRAPREPGILCVAHLYPRKQVDSLLRALTLLKSSARLRVVGTGPEGRALAALAVKLRLGDRVALLEHLPFDRLVEEYRNADLFCLPSLQEGFGIVFLEAMAAGLPIVACRATAVPEVVPDGQCGVLVPPRDVPALAIALERLLGDERERERLGAAGRQRAARFDAPLVARQFLEAIGR
jgi:phosphatidyl-myo-inositol dimannoside synthase